MNEFEKKLQEAVAARDAFIKIVEEMEEIMEAAECKTFTDKKKFEDLMKYDFTGKFDKAVDKLRIMELRNRDNY